MNDLLLTIIPATIAGIVAWVTAYWARPKISADAVKAQAEAAKLKDDTRSEELDRLRDALNERDRQAARDHQIIVELRGDNLDKTERIAALESQVRKLERRIIYLEEKDIIK